jgi:hypothetical protein
VALTIPISQGRSPSRSSRSRARKVMIGALTS